MKTNLCFDCEHYYWNNADLYADGYRGNSGWCRAYPRGVPYNYPKDGHQEIQDNQMGDFIYKKVSDENNHIVERDLSIEDKRFEEMKKGLYD